MIPEDPALVYNLLLFLVGIAVGIASGLFGVGGGFLMVPSQFWALGLLGIDPETALRTALGTSLAVVLVTAASGAWAHHRRGSVRWDVVTWSALSAAIFSFFGASFSTRMPGRPLEILLGLVLVVTAIQLLKQRTPRVEGDVGILSSTGYFAMGIPIGLLSGLLGIGGGVVLVPILTIVLRHPIRVAVGTSMPIILCAAAGGVIGYALNGPAVIASLPWSLGYVHLPGALALAAGSVPAAQLGARLAHALPPRLLSVALALLMVLTGVLMIDLPRIFGL
ncbi:MAG: sulfite exporter TauE/SafE family protein [Methanospirillum sp.]|nr:sulfite exporter TauE/SafE family protein [Methanospirillum sp.]